MAQPEFTSPAILHEEDPLIDTAVSPEPLHLIDVAEHNGTQRLTDEQKKLCEECLGLVRTIAINHLDRGLELDDLFQEGCVGLTQAALRYDPSQNDNFGLYAAKRISGSIRDAIRRRSPMSRLELEYVSRALKIKDGLQAKLGRQPSINEIAEAMEVDADKVAGIFWAYEQRDAQSIDVPIDTINGTDGVIEFHEVIADENAVSADDIISGIITELRNNFLHRALLVSGDRKRKLVEGIRGGLNQREIGNQLGVSEARVSQLRTELIKELQEIVQREENGYLVIDEEVA